MSTWIRRAAVVLGGFTSTLFVGAFVLLAFLEDLSNDDGMTVDRNASVQYGFRRAVEETDGFINFFFSNAKLEKEEATLELKQCLGRLENFVTSYPTSPLIDYADRKLEVLQKLYRAFIKT